MIPMLYQGFAIFNTKDILGRVDPQYPDIATLIFIPECKVTDDYETFKYEVTENSENTLKIKYTFL